MPATRSPCCSQARPDLVDPIEKAQAQRLDGELRYGLGQPHLGPSLLIGAARAFEPFDRVLSHHALLEAFLTFGSSQHFTEGTTGVEIAQMALESLRAQSTPPTAADILLMGVALRYCGNYADAVPAMRDAVRALATLSPEQIARWSQLGTALADDLWDEAMLRDIVDRLEGAARARREHCPPSRSRWSRERTTMSDRVSLGQHESATPSFTR